MKRKTFFLFFTLKDYEKNFLVSMIRFEMYKIVGRSFLKNTYLSSFIQFESCCGICWCCKRLKKILEQFDRKGFDTFNSHVQC